MYMLRYTKEPLQWGQTRKSAKNGDTRFSTQLRRVSVARKDMRTRVKRSDSRYCLCV